MSNHDETFCSKGGGMTMQAVRHLSMQMVLQPNDMNDMKVGGGNEFAYTQDDMPGHTHEGMNGGADSGGMGGDGGMDMHGSGMVMYMDGFRSALFPLHHSHPSSIRTPPPCLNLFVPSWTLDTRAKFVWAMMLVFALGVCVEAFSVWRVSLLKKHRRQRLQTRRDTAGPNAGDPRNVSSDVSSVSMSSTTQGRTPPLRAKRWMKKRLVFFGSARYDLAAAGVHAARAFLGYVLMLAVMTYAIEFAVCAVLGIVMGRFCLVDADFASVGENLVETAWGGEDPCCGMDDEFDNEEASSNRAALESRNEEGGTNEPLLATKNDVEMLHGPASMLRRNVSGQR